MDYYSFPNGEKIPYVGLGTWQLTDRDLLSAIIDKAYDEGYRLIDTAAAYSNEIAIKKAITAKGIKREELIITDKVWNTYRGYEAVQTACRNSLKKLKTDYLDMYLIHWPASVKIYQNWAEINADTWRGMEKLYKDGLVKIIGVCNFKKHHLEELMKNSEVTPFINQFEIHPGLPQTELIEYCRQNNIMTEASSPLGSGQILRNQVLTGIAENRNKSAAQVCLRWAIQKGIIVIPRTSKPERLHQNIDIFDFSLTADEMKEIDDLAYCGGIGRDPDEEVEFG